MERLIQQRWIDPPGAPNADRSCRIDLEQGDVAHPGFADRGGSRFKWFNPADSSYFSPALEPVARWR